VGNVYDFLIGSYLLLPRLSAQIYWVFLEKMLPEFLEEIPLAFRRNVVPSRHGCSSFRMWVPKTPHWHLQHSLDWTGLACGVACQVTRTPTILLLPMGLHKNFDLLIAINDEEGFIVPYCCGSRNLACLSAQDKFCFVTSFVFRSVAVH